MRGGAGEYRGEPRRAGRYHIGGIPTVIFFRGGKVLDTISGALDKEALVAWCKRHLA